MLIDNQTSRGNAKNDTYRDLFNNTTLTDSSRPCYPSTVGHEISTNFAKSIFNDLNNSKGVRIACLNINNLSRHTDELRVIVQNSPLDILAINETKIDGSI